LAKRRLNEPASAYLLSPDVDAAGIDKMLGFMHAASTHIPPHIEHQHHAGQVHFVTVATNGDEMNLTCMMLMLNVRRYVSQSSSWQSTINLSEEELFFTGRLSGHVYTGSTSHIVRNIPLTQSTAIPMLHAPLGNTSLRDHHKSPTNP
jgi:hypothetical protein